MKAHRLTMSKLALAHRCAWSFRIDSPQHPRPSGREARIGTLVHKLMEYQVGAGTPPNIGHLAPTADPTEAAEASALFSPPLVAFLGSRKWTAVEVGLRYDSRADTAMRGPRRGEEGYEPVNTYELAGTLDLIEMRGECVDVLDLKSGKLVQDREQLYGQAVAAARFYGATSARVGYLYARKTKCDEPQWETLDADDLDMHAGRIAKLLRKLPTVQPVAGDYCWKCDSRPSCPAYGAAKVSDNESALEEAGFFS